MGKSTRSLLLCLALGALTGVTACVEDSLTEPEPNTAEAGQANGPTLVDGNLSVRAVVEALDQPITMEFIGPDEFLVLEKATGRVKRVKDDVVEDIVLDL